MDVSSASDDQRKRALDYAVEVRKAEIDRFWSRTLVFWGFVAATFVAFGSLYDKEQSDPDILLLIACFGFVSSVAWTLQNRGSKYWREAWENKVEKLEEHVLKMKLFSNKEPLQCAGFWGASRYSVSKLATALSDLTALVWAVLAAKMFLKANPTLATIWNFASVTQVAISFSGIIVIVSIIYVLLVLSCCRSRR